jgi:GTPase SAR1 family protein
MNYNYLSNKQKREIKRKKDEHKNIEFDEFKKRLAEDYIELYDNDFLEFYNYFVDFMEKLNLPIREDFYNKFRVFLIQNSSHRETFMENEIEKYLEEITEEDDDEENDRDYDFMNHKETY